VYTKSTLYPSKLPDDQIVLASRATIKESVRVLQGHHLMNGGELICTSYKNRKMDLMIQTS
jgi:hypothetical protein